MRLRRRYYAKRLKNVGINAYLSTGVEIISPERISIGNNFMAMTDCLIAAPEGGEIRIADRVVLGSRVIVDAGSGGLIVIGDDVAIAFNSVLRSSGHAYDDPNKPIRTQGHKPGTITIQDDVWIAGGVIVLPGTLIEKGCVIGAGSVVGGHLQAYSVVAGNPARVVARRM